MIITSSHVAIGHCSIATKQNYIAMDELVQSRVTVTSKRMELEAGGAVAWQWAKPCTALTQRYVIGRRSPGAQQ